MLEIPVVRWGKNYESLEKAEVVHFETGEVMARMHQANAGLVQMDARRASKARDVLRQFSCAELIEKCRVAADLYLSATLPLGNGTQTPEQFCSIQSATTGLPLNMCRANMNKNAFVLKHMGDMLDALTRGLHTLWLPAIPLQIGLVLKPGSSEPWTPYRMYEAFAAAGVPREAFCLYPGPHDVGNKVLETCNRSMIFGGQATVEKYHGNPRVQAHGPGFSKILLGDDIVDRWEDYLDIMVKSVVMNGGRGCINCSAIWASRHTEAIAAALAERLGPIDVLPPDDPQAKLAAFTIPGAAKAIWQQIEGGLTAPGVTHPTAAYGPRLVEGERCGWLRPVVVHCASHEPAIAKAEYMFPFVAVVKCPQSAMLERIGPTLVGTAITEDDAFRGELVGCTEIDRLNLGAVPTTKLDWLQPHEGNIIDFLYRSRAFQTEAPPAH